MLNKLKSLVAKLVNDVKTADFKDPGVLIASVVFLAIPIAVGVASFKLAAHKENDIRAASVMIMASNMKHGGTGIILNSTPFQSSILTNDHVCRAVEKGGVVRSKSGDYQISDLIQSKMSDLCLVQVLADLNVNTELAEHAPKFYDEAIISGHPRLMPNVVSKGHMSGRQIIEVMTGIKKCTEEDLEGPLGIICMFLGGIPIIKSYESVLVSATIMPGSSGSGVYNTKQELAGVVFAGGSDFGYAWTVPYEQVLNFLYVEHKTIKPKFISNEIDLLGVDESSTKIKDALQKCNSATNKLILKYCNILKRDVLWRE